MERFKFIDSDAHILEPEDLWKNYLETKYQPEVIAHCKYEKASALASRGQALPSSVTDRDPTSAISEDPLVLDLKVEIKGIKMPLGAGQGEGREPTEGLDAAYERWAGQNFPPSAYREVMDQSGIDYMILYPTAGLFTTAVPEMDAEMATAIRRAYNRWLGDFCKDAGGRAFGATSIDLRDPQAAAEEVRRCVKEYNFKGVHLHPAPVPGRHLYDEACDPLWATCAELGVPIGLHPSVANPLDQGLLDYHQGLGSVQGTVGFSIGSQLACASFIMGGVLERHPELKAIFLESGAGWAAYWPERLESSVNGGHRGQRINGLSKWPAEYFQEQCFIVADQDDPGIKMVIDTLGDEVILTCTDFGHPEGRKYSRAVQDLLDLADVSLESKRKILWDNARRAYSIDPAA